jgi:hypothetical protein
MVESHPIFYYLLLSHVQAGYGSIDGNVFARSEILFGKFGNCCTVFSSLSLLLIGTFLGEALRGMSKLFCKETSLRKEVI